jgi:hypothetical protein
MSVIGLQNIDCLVLHRKRNMGLLQMKSKSIYNAIASLHKLLRNKASHTCTDKVYFVFGENMAVRTT